MAYRARLFVLALVLTCLGREGIAADARFDLIGPKIDVNVTRNGVTLPIASVPNLQAGDRLWVHPELPESQSVRYLLICVFLRGNTNPPPDAWFTRIETWDRKVRQEGAFVTVPEEAQQAILLMAPETGGDFSTLKSAVKGRPGVFVRASQDLIEAGFEEARIEKYIADIRRVPPGDAADLQKHSDLLARTLALKPNPDCFKRQADTQFTCLTQSGAQMVLDDGHGQTVVNALSNGPGSDFIQQASYTQAFGAGVYSAYVGAIVDLVRIMGNLHTAQYQYIPAISFPQKEALNLRLNTPPSFHNPKSVLVIALPSVQKAVSPPLRPADAHEVACLLKPSVVLPIEGAPLVFSTDFAHELVLHLNVPAGAPAEPDIPLLPDAYSGGLALQRAATHHVLLRDPLAPAEPSEAEPGVVPLVAEHRPSSLSSPTPPSSETPTKPEPVLITGTIQGRWGFDQYIGPTVSLQQLPGSEWRILPAVDTATAANALIPGHTAQLLLVSTGTACVHTILARTTGAAKDLPIAFKRGEPTPPAASTDAALQPLPLALTLPLESDLTPGDLHLAIQQYEQPKADEVSMRTFAEPATVASIELHAGDKSLLVQGARLGEVASLQLGDLTFSPTPAVGDATAMPAVSSTLHLSLPANAPAPPTHLDEHLTAKLVLKDGRKLSAPVTVSAPRPVISLLHKTVAPPAGSVIALANPDDLPLNAVLSFTLKSPNPFPRNGQVEIETLDGTLRTVLTLAPSGGLLLQDPHTVVATLDPLRSFGPSAFGALHLRSVYPVASPPSAAATLTTRAGTEHSPEHAAETTPAAEAPASDWLPLATLVRLPALTLLQCPPDIAQPCTITGSNLFLLDSLSVDPTFANPVAIPDGYTGDTLTVPHPAAATVFLKLRDDAAAIDSAILPTPPAPPVVAHAHAATHKSTPAPSTDTAAQPPATIPPTAY